MPSNNSWMLPAQHLTEICKDAKPTVLLEISQDLLHLVFRFDAILDGEERARVTSLSDLHVAHSETHEIVSTVTASEASS